MEILFGTGREATLSNWKALARYCEGNDLEIDNTGAKRSLRRVAVATSYCKTLRKTIMKQAI